MSRLTRRGFLQTAAPTAIALAGGFGGLPRAFAEGKGDLAGQTIQQWSFLSPAGTSAREKAIKAIVDNFQNQTGATVEFQTFPWQDLGTKLIAAVQAGSPPDSSRVNNFALKMAVRANALTDLGPYIDKTYSAEDRNDFVVDFTPSSLVNGKKWMMQIEWVPKALFIRKDWLEKAGLSAPQTWEEFVKVGQAFTSDGRWGYMFGASKTQLNQVETIFQPQIGGRGGRVLDDDDKPVFNSEAAVETYAFLRDCVHKYKITPPEVVGMTYDDVTDAFKGGRVGMIQEGSHRYRDVASAIGEENLLLAKVPSNDPNMPSPTIITGWGLGIPRNSPHPGAAWEYISYFISPDSQEINGKLAGTLPTRKSVLKRPFFQTDEMAYLRWWIDYVAQRSEAVINVATFAQLNEAMVDALHQVLLDPSSDIKPLLDNAVAQYSDAISE